ncbi:MAG: hypothetical protein QOG32_755 [Chloroflexota bacterium]|nr:hypothetical protein [Chloroflexota bacterium]
MADMPDVHAAHDEELIAALLDRDLVGPERSIAAARIASCRQCAALHADLLALSSATRAMPAVTRTRDFRLTADDARAWTAAVPAEPTAAPARLAGVMTDPRATAAHPGHDTLLVASLVDQPLAASERAAAEALVANCASCAELHADLLALQAATRALPTPERPRAYTLSADEASRIRRGGWRRFVAAFGSSRDMLTRPLAAGLTTLGLAGLLFAAAPSFLPGSASASLPPGDSLAVGVQDRTSATASSQDLSGVSGASASGAGAGPASRPSADTAGGEPQPAAVAAASQQPTLPGLGDLYGANTGRPSAPPPGAEAGTGTTKTQSGPSQAPTTLAASDSGLPLAAGPSMLVVLSGAFLIAGLGLFLVRWGARRLGDG